MNTSTKIHPGSHVLFCIDEDRARVINASRTNAGRATKAGNRVQAGDIVPAMVVRVWPNGEFNGQAFLDGNDTAWLTSVPEDRQPTFDQQTGDWIGTPGYWLRNIEPPMEPMVASAAVAPWAEIGSGEPSLGREQLILARVRNLVLAEYPGTEIVTLRDSSFSLVSRDGSKFAISVAEVPNGN